MRLKFIWLTAWKEILSTWRDRRTFAAAVFMPEANSAKLRLRMQEPFGANAFLQAIDAEKCAPAGELGWLTGGWLSGQLAGPAPTAPRSQELALLSDEVVTLFDGESR